MTYSSEGPFRAALVRTIRAFDKYRNVQGIESGATAEGFPDIFVSPNIAIEAKLAQVRNNEVCISYRPRQRPWLANHEASGGVSVLAMFLPEEGVAYFLHGRPFLERYAYPFTEWNLKLNRLDGKILLTWLDTLRGKEE